ncbi:hypothetical protein DOT_3928 [Desulfosporosinus sp. OT]|nr:hypothetical protein DOT_3928 [Desulfosporosinus sp. OT]
MPFSKWGIDFIQSPLYFNISISGSGSLPRGGCGSGRQGFAILPVLTEIKLESSR